ncbi:SUF system Fe-S cluster assembly regulator [Halothiobacillus sp. DCM-1]|uniref:SUF system Fe-S cluster assembly regulator n=1 Tax=Halothiobacillus sp. DCM-1 TaxID=3112558 RepID=UPI00324AB1A9
MLKISRMSDYAIVVLLELARQPIAQGNAKRLAAATALSLPTVGKLLKLLSAAGLLVSQQGRGGGYRLVRSPEQITLAQIIEAIDGPIAMTSCVGDHPDCSREEHCTARPHWVVLNQNLRNLLASITLARLLTPCEASPTWFPPNYPRQSGLLALPQSRPVGACHE